MCTIGVPSACQTRQMLYHSQEYDSLFAYMHGQRNLEESLQKQFRKKIFQCMHDMWANFMRKMHRLQNIVYYILIKIQVLEWNWWSPTHDLMQCQRNSECTQIIDYNAWCSSWEKCLFLHLLSVLSWGWCTWWLINTWKGWERFHVI